MQEGDYLFAELVGIRSQVPYLGERIDEHAFRAVLVELLNNGLISESFSTSLGDIRS